MRKLLLQKTIFVQGLRLLLVAGCLCALLGVFAPTVSAVTCTSTTDNGCGNGNSTSGDSDTCSSSTGENGCSGSATKCSGTDTECVCPTGSDATCGSDPVFANCKQTVQDKKQLSYKNCELQNDLFKRYVNPVIRALAGLVGLAVTIGIIIGGIQYASSGGEPQKAAAAKSRIRNSIIALVSFFFLFALIRFLVPGGESLTQ